MELAFGPFVFDKGMRQLRRGSAALHLSPKAFELLGVLVARRPQAIAKVDLHEQLWPDSFVSDGSLAVLIAEIRRTLGDSAERPTYIRTVPRFGYAFLAEVMASPPETSKTGSGMSCWLAWGEHRVRLRPGEYVLGREDGTDFCVPAVGVSRRHAAVSVREDAVTLRDLASKNGTFLNGVRVTSAVPLPDDAEIGLGAASVRFTRVRPDGLTATVSETRQPVAPR